MTFYRKIYQHCLAVKVLCLLLLVIGCKSYKEKEDALPDNRNKGTINVSADESFKPIIDEMVQVYEANHPGTRILVQYKPEAECLKDMLTDSIRLIIATRHFKDRKSVV